MAAALIAHASAILMLGTVLSASSQNTAFPPENILDDNLDTFHVTTGMFPQEIVIQLASPLQIKKITLNSTGGSLTNAVAEWNIYGAKDDFDYNLILADNGGLQTCAIESHSDTIVTYLKLQITKGSNIFASINRLAIQAVL